MHEGEGDWVTIVLQSPTQTSTMASAVDSLIDDGFDDSLFDQALANAEAEGLLDHPAPTPVKVSSDANKIIDDLKTTPLGKGQMAVSLRSAAGTPTLTKTFDVSDPMRRRLSLPEDDSITPIPEAAVESSGLVPVPEHTESNERPNDDEIDDDIPDLDAAPPMKKTSELDESTNGLKIVLEDSKEAVEIEMKSKGSGQEEKELEVKSSACVGKEDEIGAKSESQAEGDVAPKTEKTPPCSACGDTTLGKVITPHPDGKRKMLLCIGCTTKALFCQGCGSIRKSVPVSDETRCTICGYLGCVSAPDCYGACTKCTQKLRPLLWRRCRKSACGQRWAEANRWCATCGSCALKSCTPKLFSCKLESCKRNVIENPCSRMASTGAQLSRKHYHCAQCHDHAAKHDKCSSCDRSCSCEKCNTCGTGACCHTGVTKCSAKGCEADICRKCVGKISATGKNSGLCAEHRGVKAAILAQKKKNRPKRMKMTPEALLANIVKAKNKAAVSRPTLKRKRCSQCDGTERPEKARFRQINGAFFCGPCSKSTVVKKPKHDGTDNKPEPTLNETESKTDNNTTIPEERATKPKKNAQNSDSVESKADTTHKVLTAEPVQ